MLACECDETWHTLCNMRPEAKKKLLPTVCILVQEVMEDKGLAERFKIGPNAGGKTNSMPASCTTT